MTNNPIDREDWITRFFGYLGSFSYLREKREGEELFLQELTRVIKGDKRVEHKEDARKSDNIVYIYGGANGGKSTYVDLLELELKKHWEYICVRYKFNTKEVNCKTMQDLPMELRGVFEKAPADFRFPFMNRMDTNQDGVVNKLDMAGATFNLFTGDVMAIKELGAGLMQLLDPKREKKIEKEHLYTQFLEVLASCEDEYRLSELITENPFLFTMIDLWCNLKKEDEAQYICIIDDFDCFLKRIQETSKKEENIKNVEKLMEMMRNMSDIVWVLISKERANPVISQYIHRQNCWRMTGLDKRRTIEYIKLACPDRESMIPEDVLEYWLSMVYEKTKGYVALLNLCVERENSTEGKSDCFAWVKRKKAQALLWDVNSEEIEQNTEKYYKMYLESWFTSVWNGRTTEAKTAEPTGRSIESELMSNEFKIVRSNIRGQEDVSSYIIPCLCYIVSKSLEYKGTVKQYSWSKNDNLKELNSDGRKCMAYIAEYLPFCIEYTEYEGTVFLDSVIVDIMYQHDRYKVWLDMFYDKCMNKDFEDNTDMQKHMDANVLDTTRVTESDEVLKVTTKTVQGIQSSSEQENSFAVPVADFVDAEESEEARGENEQRNTRTLPVSGRAVDSSKTGSLPVQDNTNNISDTTQVQMNDSQESTKEDDLNQKK